MINVVLLSRNDGLLVGFKIKGHAGTKRAKSEESGLVCASVSSCAIMICNTFTEVLNVEAEIKTNDDGFLFLMVRSGDFKFCSKTLKGLELHLRELSKKYPDYLEVSKKEVKDVKN